MDMCTKNMYMPIYFLLRNPQDHTVANTNGPTNPAIVHIILLVVGSTDSSANPSTLERKSVLAHHIRQPECTEVKHGPASGRENLDRM